VRKQVSVLAFVAGAFAACSTGSGPDLFGDAGDAGGGSDTSTMGKKDSTPPLLDGSGSDVKSMGDGHCAASSYTAQAAPAAMLFVLDASGSMGNDNKYSDAQLAIVTAMDNTVFNTMSLGLLLYPQKATVPAMCPALAGLPVNCAISALTQVPLALAGTDTSNATGVRHDIYQELVASTPTKGPGNGNPIYDALNSGIETLQSFKTSRRILFLITDGGASCTSQDTPQRPYYVDPNGCDDWENPKNIVSMLSAAHAFAAAPINTLVVGVQGADNTDKNDDPPYRIRLALSAYALAGSPETTPAGCNGVYTQTGADPTIPCHFDLTTTPSFSTALAADIGKVRSQLLGCTFELPIPKSGTVNMNEVNVEYSVDGGKTIDLDRRASASDPCTTGGCWDYNASGEVELLGAACTAVEAATSADVKILVGCDTVIK
jgi:hypothetical protein